MQVVEVGDIGLHHNDWMPEDYQLPETGIIIQATREELRDSRLGSLLYQDVNIYKKGGELAEAIRELVKNKYPFIYASAEKALNGDIGARSLISQMHSWAKAWREAWRYIEQGVDYFTVSCGGFNISYDGTRNQDEDKVVSTKAPEEDNKYRATIRELIDNLEAAATTLESMYSIERCHYRDAIDKAKEALLS